jgi:hypothetical protein
MKKIDVSNLGEVTEPMNEDQYWELVDKSLKNSKNRDEQEAYLIKELSKLSPQEMLGFTIKSYGLSWDINTSEMWCAGYLMNEGCSDDGFEYFKRWVVSKGKEVYYNAKKNPDSLIDAIEENADYYEFETFLYSGQYAFENLTGRESDEFFDYGKFLENHEGTGWDYEFNWEEDEPETMKAICPQLFEKFWTE